MYSIVDNISFFTAHSAWKWTCPGWFFFMELVLLVIKNQQSKKCWLFLLFVGNARLLFKKQTENTEAFLHSTKSITLIFISQRYLLFVNTIQTLSMYIYTLKNEIVLYLLLCNLTFFHLAYWEHPAIVLKCICSYSFQELFVFPRTDSNSALLSHILIVSSFLQFVINKASLNEYPCAHVPKGNILKLTSGIARPKGIRISRSFGTDCSFAHKKCCTNLHSRQQFQ